MKPQALTPNGEEYDFYFFCEFIMEPVLLDGATFELQIQHLIGGFIVMNLDKILSDNNIPFDGMW